MLVMQFMVSSLDRDRLPRDPHDTKQVPADAAYLAKAINHRRCFTSPTLPSIRHASAHATSIAKAASKAASEAPALAHAIVATPAKTN